MFRLSALLLLSFWICSCNTNELQGKHDIRLNIVEAVAHNEVSVVESVLNKNGYIDLNKCYPIDCLIVRVRHGGLISSKVCVPLIGKVINDSRILAQKKKQLDNSVSVERLRFSPLYLAIKNENLEIVDLLLRAGASPNMPFMGSAEGGPEPIKSLDSPLVRRFFNITGMRGVWGDMTLEDVGVQVYLEKPLIIAVMTFNLPIVTRLLDTPGMQINQDYLGQTPLHLSVRMLDVEITKLLLEAGANPNTRIPPVAYHSTTEGFTPLHLLANKEFLIVYLKLEGERNERQNAHLNQHSSKPDNPKAIVAGEIVELLVKHGADINAKTIDGKTAADLAEKNFKEILPYLEGIK